MLGWEETGHLEVSGSVGVVEGTEEQGGGFWGLEEAAGVGVMGLPGGVPSEQREQGC